MTTKKLSWRLPVLMAEHGIRSAADLQRRLAALGYEITPVHAARLVHNRPQRLSADMLEALVSLFDCTVNDLLAVEQMVTSSGHPGRPGHSRLLHQMITEDMATGRSIVVFDPKGDALAYQELHRLAEECGVSLTVESCIAPEPRTPRSGICLRKEPRGPHGPLKLRRGKIKRVEES